MRQLSPLSVIFLQQLLNNRAASSHSSRSHGGGEVGRVRPKQVNIVIEGMSETTTADWEGEGITRTGPSQRPKSAEEREAEDCGEERKAADIRKRLNENTEEQEKEQEWKLKQLSAIPCSCPFSFRQHSWERAKGVRVLWAVSRADLCRLWPHHQRDGPYVGLQDT